MHEFIVLALAGFIAGGLNAVAGGGPIITLGAMVALGFDPKIANLTSTVALCPGQLAAGGMARTLAKTLPERAGPGIVALCLIGGAAGALLLLLTPSSGFREAVPWLVLFATAIYAWKAWAPALAEPGGLHGKVYAALLALMAVYGGYFGGGNSFLVLALLAASGVAAKPAGEMKNYLIAAINLGAVAVFVWSGAVAWNAALPLAAGSLAGSWSGAKVYGRLNVAAIRTVVIASGLALAGWFFMT